MSLSGKKVSIVYSLTFIVIALAKTKLTMPVLALGRGVCGGNAPLNSMKFVATNVRGC
jgi:hypothetical protein